MYRVCSCRMDFGSVTRDGIIIVDRWAGPPSQTQLDRDPCRGGCDEEMCAGTWGEESGKKEARVKIEDQSKDRGVANCATKLSSALLLPAKIHEVRRSLKVVLAAA